MEQHTENSVAERVKQDEFTEEDDDYSNKPATEIELEEMTREKEKPEESGRAADDELFSDENNGKVDGNGISTSQSHERKESVTSR